MHIRVTCGSNILTAWRLHGLIVWQSPHGHALLASAVARYILTRLCAQPHAELLEELRAELLHVTNPHRAPGGGSNRRGARTGGGVSLVGIGGAEEAREEEAKEEAKKEEKREEAKQEEAKKEQVTEEACYPSADVLPLVGPLQGSWSVVDEGGAKGVKKLGLLSTQVS